MHKESKMTEDPGPILVVTPQGEETYTGWWVVPPEAALIDEHDSTAHAVAKLVDGRFVENWCVAHPWSEPWDPGGWATVSAAGERYVYDWGDGPGAADTYENEDTLLESIPLGLQGALLSLLVGQPATG
jgi:hypothetical protein